MLHHLSLPVSDLQRSSALYDAALGALGYERVWTADTAVGYGPPGGGDKLALKHRGPVSPPSPGFHVAFSANSTDAVHAFWREALGAGATDDGAPGLRPHYGAGYYAAFVIDFDGARLEAVFKAP